MMNIGADYAVPKEYISLAYSHFDETNATKREFATPKCSVPIIRVTESRGGLKTERSESN